MSSLLIISIFFSNSLGVGLYGNIGEGVGFGFSIRSVSEKMAIQGVIGGIHIGEWGGGMLLGGRLAFIWNEGGRKYRYIHCVVPALWLAFVSGGGEGALGIRLSACYEFEFWPNPSDLPIAFGLGAGLSMSFKPVGVYLFMPFNIHFYF
jgi:hypothetical protein